jgi:putative tricarboxylic transport membrane protein
MSGLDQLLGGFAIALSWKGLLYCFLGCLWGTVVGVLPGLGPLAGMTLLLPLTFGLDPTFGIIMLTGIFYGAMYHVWWLDDLNTAVNSRRGCIRRHMH